jgi:hypothetical protein
MAAAVNLSVKLFMIYCWSLTLLLFGVVASWKISPKIAPTPIPETTSMQNGEIS